MVRVNGRYPHTESIVSKVIKDKPMHRKFLNSALNSLTNTEYDDAEKYLSFLGDMGITHKKIAESYLTIVNDTFREELKFRKTGKYSYSSFLEAQENVYNNSEYMERYMVGLAISSFWWANHAEMRRFFKKILPQLSKLSGVYREVGPGHGMYFLEALHACNFDLYEGIDISPTSVAMSKHIVDSGFYGHFPNANIVLGDFLDTSKLELASALVMGEVLEHVEDPGVFLQRAYETTTDNVLFFMTTCINAPAIDHLYNPESVSNLETLIMDHGFLIHDKCLVPREGKTLIECENDRLAINVAYLLGKKL